jgi:hypothetical protein
MVEACCGDVMPSLVLAPVRPCLPPPNHGSFGERGFVRATPYPDM